MAVKNRPSTVFIHEEPYYTTQKTQEVLCLFKGYRRRKISRARCQKAHRGDKAQKMNPQHYSMLIQWDDEDNIFIVSVPELKIKTHGKTYEEAIKNALEVIELWLEVAAQEGRPIPPPQKYAA